MVRCGWVVAPDGADSQALRRGDLPFKVAPTIQVSSARASSAAGAWRLFVMIGVAELGSATRLMEPEHLSRPVVVHGVVPRERPFEENLPPGRAVSIA
jgi:hypothetical protein